MPNHKRRSELAALALSLFLLTVISFALGACGSDDLFFPGDLLPTNTEEPTSTATPDDT